MTIERAHSGEKHHTRERIFHDDRRRAPERVGRALGFGVHGYFENYRPLGELTCAEPFGTAGQRTQAFVRFSAVAGNTGSADLARDVRGFAVKFDTGAGNWDLIGNNIPVSCMPDLTLPDVGQTAHDNFWNFVSRTPESTHPLMWIMSDRAIPRSLRFMEGFGLHTYRLMNAEGRSTFVKFHWKPTQGLQSVLWSEAVKINDADPDFHRRDLWHAVSSGNYPEWELGLQLFDEKFAAGFAFDIGDPTKLIPEEDVPVRRVGRLVLDRVVDSATAESEPVTFHAANIVPGIEFADDSLPRPAGAADHYSQARQFFISQTEIEKRHLIDAFVFELSKCGRLDIRTRMVAGLRNVGDPLAGAVARGLGLPELPDHAEPWRGPVLDLAPSPALSILANGPDSFAGRKIGVLLTDGFDPEIFDDLCAVAAAERSTVEVIAPKVGVVADDGARITAEHKLDGASSVRYDAVVVLASEHAAIELALAPAARDFVTDAYAHCKFIGHDAADALFDAAGLSDMIDHGFVALGVGTASASEYVRRCRELRFWGRHWL